MSVVPELFVLAAKREEQVDTRKFLLVGRTTCREEKRLRLVGVTILSTSVKKLCVGKYGRKNIKALLKIRQ